MSHPSNVFFAARLHNLERFISPALPLTQDWVVWTDGSDWGHVGVRPNGWMYATKFDPAQGRHVDLKPDPVRAAEYEDYCGRLRDAARRRLAR